MEKLPPIIVHYVAIVRNKFTQLINQVGDILPIRLLPIKRVLIFEENLITSSSFIPFFFLANHLYLK